MSRQLLQYAIGLSMVGVGLWLLFGVRVFAAAAILAGLALIIDAKRAQS